MFESSVSHSGGPLDKHEFTLQVDASNCGLSCVSTQERDRVEHVISYASRSLNLAERNYLVTKRENLAALWGIRKLRFSVEGSHLLLLRTTIAYSGSTG